MPITPAVWTETTKDYDLFQAQHFGFENNNVDVLGCGDFTFELVYARGKANQNDLDSVYIIVENSQDIHTVIGTMTELIWAQSVHEIKIRCTIGTYDD